MDEITTSFRRNRLAVVVLMILLVAIPLSIYLVRQQQILKGRAVHNSSITFVAGVNNSTTPPTATNQNITVRLFYEPDTAPTPVPATPTTIAPTAVPTTVGPTSCTISGPPSFSSSTGASYNVESNITCASATLPVSTPGACFWYLSGLFGRSLQDAFSNRTTLNITAADGVPATGYNLIFQRNAGPSLPRLICYKNITVTGSGSSTGGNNTPLTYTISGNANLNRIPTDGVRVTMSGGPTVTSDGTGRYIFSNVSPGTYSMTASLPPNSGYGSGDCDYPLETVSVPPDRNVDITIRCN